MANILVIDDGEDILSIVKLGLEKDGHAVTILTTPTNLITQKISFYDVILLDIMMPKVNGYEALKEFRSMTDSPIIFLTAKTAEEDILYGLSLGADDYLTKPFRISELRARVNAHIRRESREHFVTLNLGDFRFNLSQKKLYFKEKVVNLTKGEYEICEFLARNRGRIYARDQIYESVFGYDAEGDSQSISTHIKNIRSKFDNPEDSPIYTRWGVGYVWE
ncbi:response regulator transcription factor [Listeria monocytogenes]|nr:response regulator transcription factor [Listeria monocytogenes]EII2166246.1 response regulator transcription factor [Listeria monocytogenes]EII2287564.1 response regulator transcription factor [Listeria monocytogenes]